MLWFGQISASEHKIVIIKKRVCKFLFCNQLDNSCGPFFIIRSLGGGNTPTPRFINLNRALILNIEQDSEFTHSLIFSRCCTNCVCKWKLYKLPQWENGKHNFHAPIIDFLLIVHYNLNLNLKKKLRRDPNFLFIWAKLSDCLLGKTKDNSTYYKSKSIFPFLDFLQNSSNFE